MKHKQFTGEVKAKDNGQVTAIFSQFNVRDHDNDVTLPGAFEDGAKVRVSAYNHSSWADSLPVGHGVIKTQGDFAIADMQFFLTTTQGKETFEVVKHMSEVGLQEWSYGYDTLKASFGEFEGQQVQFLEQLKVHEVSPVLLGAGIGTTTLSVKSLSDQTDEELLAEVTRLGDALKNRGVALPDNICEMVRVSDAATAEMKRQRDSLLFIAAVHGIDTNTEGN